MLTYIGNLWVSLCFRTRYRLAPPQKYLVREHQDHHDRSNEHGTAARGQGHDQLFLKELSPFIQRTVSISFAGRIFRERARATMASSVGFALPLSSSPAY